MDTNENDANDDYDDNDDEVEGDNIADSEATITLSSPSQKCWMSSQESELVSPRVNKLTSRVFCEELGEEILVDENENIVLEKSLFEKLLKNASNSCNFKEELEKIKIECSRRFGKHGNPITEPSQFRKLCHEAGAFKIFDVILDAMSSERHSEQRKSLNEKRALSIIYVMLYGQSQAANWFQVATTRTLKGLGLTSRGVETLRNMGLAAHPLTVASTCKKISSEHLETVKKFFEDAVDNEYMVIAFIDDYHNIHTNHRPSSDCQTNVAHMATLLVKSFKNVKAIDSTGPDDQDKKPANNALLQDLLQKNLSTISKSYVQVMPDWLQAKFFDPESQRSRLLVHDYQKDDIIEMRSMQNCKLVDCVELPLKSRDNFQAALNIMLDNGLAHYLERFVVPLVGDWPCQFYIRQVVYNESIHNLIPFIGPLHVSLNARENILLKFHPFFAELYSFLFDGKKVLAKNPKPWRISLLLEVVYGGWLIVRDAILSVFGVSKDIQFLTLLNLLDTYVPMSLCIYSVIFRDNMADLYFQSLFRCWLMFLVFRRRHYDKAPLIALSNLEYWKSIDHPIVEALFSSLCCFDEYAVENFHSVLRSRTKIHDNAERITSAAREIDGRKHDLSDFQAAFVPKRTQFFSHGNIKLLKMKAAEFLTKKFREIASNPNSARLVRKPTKPGQRMTKWVLPHVFGDERNVTNDVLPMGFLSYETSPHPLRYEKYHLHSAGYPNLCISINI